MEVLIRLHSELSQLLPDFLLGRNQDVHRHYMKYLYRRDGFFLFTDIQGQFRAQIKDVTPEGRLVLQREDGWERAYASRKSASMLSKAEIKDIRSLHDAKGRSSQQRFIAGGN